MLNICRSFFFFIFLLSILQPVYSQKTIQGIIKNAKTGDPLPFANIQVVDNASTIPILRPLIGMDKEEIITISKKIGAYDLSILETIGCTAVPQKPATSARIDQLESIEENLPINDLVKKVVKDIVWK